MSDEQKAKALAEYSKPLKEGQKWHAVRWEDYEVVKELIREGQLEGNVAFGDLMARAPVSRPSEGRDGE